MKFRVVNKCGEIYVVNTPHLLTDPILKIDIPCYKSKISSFDLLNISLLQSMYSHNLLSEDMEIFDDINVSIQNNYNVIKKHLENYYLAIEWLDNNPLIDKYSLITILNMISPGLKIQNVRNKNIKVEVFFNSEQKYWYFASPKDIDYLLINYINTINSFDKIEVLPYVYSQLILIHPFSDGNGRLSRFLQIYYSFKLNQKIKKLIPISYFYRNAKKNRELEHKKIKKYCKTNDSKYIQDWFKKLTEYSRNQLQYIETEINKHIVQIESEFGNKVIPQNFLFQVHIETKKLKCDQKILMENLVKKQYFAEIGDDYINLLLCTILSILKKNRNEFNINNIK